MKDHYDVVVMGGGPAGSTLAAALREDSRLSVAVFEKERFPREHIGESFSHRVVSSLEEIGALERVLESPYWIKKYGGYYAWDPQRPSTTRFDDNAWHKDGVWRWSMHVNRAQFDALLLRHARARGAEVFEGVAVTQLTSQGDGHHLVLSDGRSCRCSIFVEASGRQTSLLTRRRRSYLSEFKNVAVWNHFVGARPAQSLDGDWNIFRDDDLSAIGSFAFRDGWFWYIPVPREVDGELVETHSIGLVTDPLVLKEANNQWLDPEYFTAQLRDVPLLGELVEHAAPISDQMLTATNYSMISERFCDYDERWVLLGDAAFFVDPLFSSGVAFATMQGLSAALMIRCTLDSTVPPEARRELWEDYEQDWQRIARSFALAIDQWYHAIADAHPESVYWQRRSRTPQFDFRDQTFQKLVDTDVAIPPDLAAVLGSSSPAKFGSGPLADVVEVQKGRLPEPDDMLELAPDTRFREGLTLNIGRSKGSYKPWEKPQSSSEVAEFWRDPVEYGRRLPAAYAEPEPCHVFESAEGHRIKCAGDVGSQIYRALREGPVRYGDLAGESSSARRKLLDQLIRANLIRIGHAST